MWIIYAGEEGDRQEALQNFSEALFVNIIPAGLGVIFALRGQL
jgi:hypothetical protein